MAQTGSFSADEHEFHFNPQRACPDFAAYRARRAPANAAAAARLHAITDVPYGAHPRRRLDIYPAPRPGAPVHVFFHGGYWRANDKAGFAFVADALVRQGTTAVVANYELCPASTLDGTVDSALAAIEWTARHIAEHGGDGRALTLSGHSAGAHLCAAALATDWAGRGLEPGFIRGATMISGIYDPTPAMATTVNADLHLTPEIAARHNYEAAPPLARCPIHLFAGGLEPWAWIDLSTRYATALRRHGRNPELHVLPPFNHFSILDAYLDATSPISRAIGGGAGHQGPEDHVPPPTSDPDTV